MAANESRASLVGRDDEIRLLMQHVNGGEPRPVMFLHGHAGTGKTALLQELQRRRGNQNWQWVEAAELESGSAGWSSRPPEVLIVDSLGPTQGGPVRELIAALLPAGTRIVVASRQPPAPGWHEASWDAALAVTELGPLDPEAAVTLLRDRGVTDPETIAALARWAKGEPLALVAASAESRRRDFDPGDLHGDPNLASRIVDHVLGRDLGAAGDLSRDDAMRVLDVAAAARGVDVSTLAAVLGDVDPVGAFQWLDGLSISRPLGTRLTIDDRLRRALCSLLRHAHPAEYQEVRRRLADHTAERARGGEPRFLLELAELIEAPELAWGMGSEAGTGLGVGPASPVDAAAAAVEFADRPRRWAALQRWFREAPDHVLAIRDGDGKLVGAAVTVGMDDLPEWAEEDPVVAPWLVHARVHHDPAEAVLLRDGLIFVQGDLRARVAAVGNAAVVTGRAFHARWFYVMIEPDDDDKVAFVEALGYRRCPGLDVADPEYLLHSYVLHLGHGGFVGTTRDLVYRDLGLDPSDYPPGDAPDRQDVVEALRGFHKPGVLLPNPLGGDRTGEERVRVVRGRIRGAIEAVFEDHEMDRLRRSAVERGYLAAGSSHARAARSLHLSRATYFRRLSEGVDRIARYLTGGEAAS